MTNPAEPSGLYRAMAEKWDLPRSLMGGTAMMRAAGQQFLPRHPAENESVYRERARRAVLRNYFRRTVQKITGRLFRHALVPSDEVPAELIGLLKNVDLSGRGLNSFMHAWFEEALVMGISYALVDFPTRAQTREDLARPYAVHIPTENLIGWRQDENSLSPRLLEVRIRERGVLQNGYREVVQEQVRILYPGYWKLFRKGEKDRWSLVTEGETSLSEIPLVPLYTHRTGFMAASPPLEDLAYLNLEHYQIRSDQRNALNVASFPILAASGYDAELDGPIEVGPNKVLTTSDTSGKYYYVESSGAALEAGARELQELEKAIQLFGLQFESGPIAETATGRRIDAAEANAPIHGLVTEVEEAANGILRLFARWSGVENNGALQLLIPPGGSADSQAGKAISPVEQEQSAAIAAEQRESFNSLPD